MEFGVGAGRSLRTLRMSFAGRHIHAFDSFNGLPEDWVMTDNSTAHAGEFAYEQPKHITGIIYHAGWFKDTIPEWKTNNPGMIAFLHIDSDLYSSCKTVLEELNRQIVPSTVIVFDEMFESIGYKNWLDGEYKAFNEWKSTYGRKTHELGRTDNGQASFRVLR